MVGPLYRDPRPAAQLLISSAAHQSLVHDHRLAKSLGPHIAAVWIPLEGYLEAADGPRSEESGIESEKERMIESAQEGERDAFIYALFERSFKRVFIDTRKVDGDKADV